MSRGKSHTRWFPAWRITPTTIAAAIVCHYNTSNNFVLLAIFLIFTEWNIICPFMTKALMRCHWSPHYMFLLHHSQQERVWHELPWHGIAQNYCF
jgi:hypothetical protein